jgi:hypothetical protein
LSLGVVLQQQARSAVHPLRRNNPQAQALPGEQVVRKRQ